MKPAAPATFVISIDLEMSWGSVHHGRPHRTTPYEDERDIVSTVLRLMEKHGISATWAIVGHLFLSSCAPVEGRKHPEIRRPKYRWHTADWYDLDPSSSVAEDPTWYGPDLIEMIESCGVQQEIGSHSFGHIIAGDPDCDSEAFESDLRACKELADEAGITLASFVYPRNSIAHLDVLERLGFTAFRGAPRAAGTGHGTGRRRLDSLARALIPRLHRPEHPQWLGNLVDVPQTYLFDPDSETARRMGTGLWSLLVRRQLEGAIQTGSLFHLWFHTHNLSANRSRSFRALDDLFGAARKAMDAGRLENLTMSQVAGRLGSQS